jgi:hypothetical protein
LGRAFVAGRKRVPKPAAGMMAFLTFMASSIGNSAEPRMKNEERPGPVGQNL